MASEDENDVEDRNARIRRLEMQLAESERKAEDAARAAALELERANNATTENDIERARSRLASEERDAVERRAKEAEQQLDKANSDLTEANKELADTTRELATAKTNGSQAKRQLEGVTEELDRVKEELADARKDLRERGRFEKLAEKEYAARTELRDFVSCSLSDIMRGVDDAALSAVGRHLESGLLEEPMISPSRVGQLVNGSETLVNFDIAVIASTKETRGDKKTRGLEAGVKVSKVMEVVGLAGSAGFQMRRESGKEEQSGRTQHHRIRFAVPLIFASQDELIG